MSCHAGQKQHPHVWCYHSGTHTSTEAHAPDDKCVADMMWRASSYSYSGRTPRGVPRAWERGMAMRLNGFMGWGEQVLLVLVPWRVVVV